MDALLAWNEPSLWKFAWPNHVGEYLCFAETGWGDQYAYRVDELERGSERIYCLDALEMEPEELCFGFEAFIEHEFLRASERPFDSMTIQARAIFGDLPAGFHLVCSPSPLISGVEDLASVQVAPARLGMTLNGDIMTQLRSAEEGDAIERIEPYTDESGRARVRLLWAK